MTSEFTNYANVFHSYFPPFQIVCSYFIYQLRFIVILACQLSGVVAIFVIIIYPDLAQERCNTENTFLFFFFEVLFSLTLTKHPSIKLHFFKKECACVPS